MKSLFSLVLVFVMLNIPIRSYASGYPQRVFDNAKLLSSEVDNPNEYGPLQSLQGQIWALRALANYDAAVLLLDDFIGYNTHEDFAKAFYEHMELGVGNDRSGVLVIVDTYQQCCFVYTVGKCTEYAPTEQMLNEYADSVLQALNDRKLLGIRLELLVSCFLPLIPQ